MNEMALSVYFRCYLVVDNAAKVFSHLSLVIFQGIDQPDTLSGIPYCKFANNSLFVDLFKLFVARS